MRFLWDREWNMGNACYGTLGYSIWSSRDGVQIAEAEQAAAEMPAWPTTGSVVMKNGIIIVKLSCLRRLYNEKGKDYSIWILFVQLQ